MRVSLNTYIPKETPIHTGDARVKLVLLLAYSITLFFVDTWVGMALCALLFVVAEGVSRIPPKALLVPLIPLYILLFFTILFNAFAFDIQAAAVAQEGFVVPGTGGGMFEPVPLFGAFGFVPAGFARGCFYAVRIFLLVLMSLIVSLSTTSTALTDAFRSFLSPLRRLRVPVEDLAMMASIALRFIPITAEELHRIRTAQLSRGAEFSEGGVLARLRIWQTVLVPLFVGLFRRADNVALAMEARCYGLGQNRTSLYTTKFTPGSALIMAIGLIICFLLAFFL